MKPLAERAIKCVRDGEVNFVPARFEKFISTGWKI